MVVALLWASVLAFAGYVVALVAGVGAAYAGWSAGGHIRLAIPATVLFVLTQSMSMFYFIGTGSQIKEIVKDHGLDGELIARGRRFKNRIFPPMTLALGVVMATFVVGGGAHTGVLPGWVHGLLALAGLVTAARATSATIRGIGENADLLEDVGRALAARETG